MSTTAMQPPADAVDGKQALADAIGRQARDGWHVESQSDLQATLVKGKPTNHVLHVILCIVTFGLWIPVWILTVIFAGEKHELLTVQPDGSVQKRKS
jgi:hypothetical protein